MILCWLTNSLQWRHNEPDGVSNHRRLDCLLNRLFRCRSKKTSKLRVTGLYEGNSPVTGEFPAQRASNAENVSIWWRHHESLFKLKSCEPAKKKKTWSEWWQSFQMKAVSWIMRKRRDIVGPVLVNTRVNTCADNRTLAPYLQVPNDKKWKHDKIKWNKNGHLGDMPTPQDSAIMIT